MKVADIKALLDEKGVEYKASATKPELEQLAAENDIDLTEEGDEEAEEAADDSDKEADAVAEAEKAATVAAAEAKGVDTADAEAHAESVAAGENTHGVLSPDPSVGEKVPAEIVPPGHTVNPRSGAVVEGAWPGAATPRPNPDTSGKPVSAKPGQEWGGNHTV